jgi:hypothetical protein
MLYIAAGMPRAGSGWHYNLLHDLVVAAGGDDARQIRRNYLLHALLTEVNCNIRALSPQRLFPVLLPATLGKRFAIKTHSAPSSLAKRFLANEKLRATYIYRDPRAALLSAMEYGQRARAAGSRNAFSALENFEDALQFILDYVRIADQWLALDSVHSLSYENFLNNYDDESKRLLDFLKADHPAPALSKVVAKYHPEAKNKESRGMHFQHGEAERFRSELTVDQLAQANQYLAPFLERLGYTI